MSREIHGVGRRSGSLTLRPSTGGPTPQAERGANINARFRRLTTAVTTLSVVAFLFVGARAAAQHPVIAARPTATTAATTAATTSATTSPSASPKASPGTQSQISARATQDESGQLSLVGTLTTDTGEAIPAAEIAIAYDGAPFTILVTDAQGSFTLITIRQAFGTSHTLTLTYRGGIYAGSTITIPVISSNPTAVLSASLNPTLIAPGEVLEVAGSLADAAGTPLPGARIEVTLSLGGTATAVTSDDGNWAVFIELPPPDPNNPVSSSTRVWITFAGDGMFPATDLTLQLAMRAATPSPTPTPSPSASPSESPSALAAASTSAAPAVAPAGPSWTDRLPSATATVVLAIVLVLIAALGALIGATVLSRRRSALTVGEQRGFGDLL